MKHDRIILDGATGTYLQREGMPLGALPEVYGAERAEVLTKIHRSYIDAGSEVIYTCTFGANRRKLSRSGRTPAEIIPQNVRAAKEAAAGRAKVALSVGPIGELMQPLGTLSFEEAYDIYREAAVLGEQAGADLLVFETFTDLGEARAALLAAKESCSLPVWVTMSFEANGRTFTGTEAGAAALCLSRLGADAVGANCSLGPEELYPVLASMRAWTDKPLIAKPNAGLPDPETGEYTLSPEAFRAGMEKLLSLGVSYIGGCCGTGPDDIRAIAPLGSAETEARDVPLQNGLCSSRGTVPFGRVRPVGERLNPTGKKRLREALQAGDTEYLCRLAIEQAEAGAEVLDVNCGVPGIDEADVMRRAVESIQAVTDVPLMIDASDPAVLEAGLRHFAGRAVINSVNGTEASLGAVLPLAKKYGAAVVALCLDENGIPETAEARLRIAERILARAAEYGLTSDDILLDTLTVTVSAEQAQAKETLRALAEARRRFGVHGCLGVSNISFGLPQRETLTACFLSEALAAGLDFPILNPNSAALQAVLYSHRALCGEDEGCRAYTERFAALPAAEGKVTAGAPCLREAVKRGLKEEACRAAAEKLLSCTETELIDGELIPVLNEVGEGFEKGTLYLPQLIASANAACAVFELIRARLGKAGGSAVSRGKILVATVKGDIHDIGKNIAKVILENYGYTVIDLGRDVPKERILETAQREGVGLIGLSALMTTTASSLAETVRLIKQSGCKAKVYAAGAVVTAEFAAKTGADYYAADAQASVKIAEEVFR